RMPRLLEVREHPLQQERRVLGDEQPYHPRQLALELARRVARARDRAEEVDEVADEEEVVLVLGQPGEPREGGLAALRAVGLEERDQHAAPLAARLEPPAVQQVLP